MKHITQHTLTKTLARAVGSYLLVWLLLVSAESMYLSAQRTYFTNQDYTYWATYLSVEPVKSVFRDGEKLEFESVVQWRKPTKMGWNDIIKCDVNGDGHFSYWSDYESGPVKKTAIEAGVTSGTWFYGDETTSYPPPGVDCLIESHIIIEPEELKVTTDGDREQTVTSRSTFQVE